MELQQSSIYADYIASLGWEIITKDGVRMFYKKIPLMGGMLKIQRPNKLPDVQDIVKVKHIRLVAIEPKEKQNLEEYKAWCASLSKICRVSRSEFMPTKTILVDVTPKDDDIFSSFSEAKRRAVRKAIKNNITITQSSYIKELIRIKNKSGGFFGFITTYGIDKLWRLMNPDQASILLARHHNEIVGGVLLVFWNHTAHYWIAGASKKGKHLFAPTLLVWEALKLSKKYSMKYFDFVGVWDERQPKNHTEWIGFTKFKEGFGGKNLYYPVF